MLRRCLFAVVCGFVVIGLSLPAAGQDKDKDKKEPTKDAKDNKEKKDEPKDTKDKAKALLKWKLAEGKTFYQEMVTETKQTMKVNQQNEVKQTQKQTFVFGFTPEKKEGDNWTIKQKIESVQMDIDIGGTKISYDSSKTDTTANPLGEFFKALVGTEFKLTVNAPEGKEWKVTKIEGRDDFVKKLGNANPQMQPLLNTILTEQALVEMAQPTFAALPNKEVTQGESWTRTSTLDMGPIGKYENTYKYTYEGKDKDGKLDVIKIETTLKYQEPKADAGAGGLPFRIKKATLDSKPATGTMKYNAEAGRIESSEINVDLKGTLDIEIGGMTTQVSLDQTQNTKATNRDTNPSAKP